MGKLTVVHDGIQPVWLALISVWARSGPPQILRIGPKNRISEAVA